VRVRVCPAICWCEWRTEIFLGVLFLTPFSMRVCVCVFCVQEPAASASKAVEWSSWVQGALRICMCNWCRLAKSPEFGRDPVARGSRVPGGMVKARTYLVVTYLRVLHVWKGFWVREALCILTESSRVSGASFPKNESYSRRVANFFLVLHCFSCVLADWRMDIRV